MPTDAVYITESPGFVWLWKSVYRVWTKRVPSFSYAQQRCIAI